jgi:hypothetical protein
LEKIATEFYETRKAQEGHSLTTFFVNDPNTTLVQLLATGFFKNTFYRSYKDIFSDSVAVHRAADDDFHLTALKTFRTLALTKDQVLLGLMVRNEKPSEVRAKYEPDELELLSSFPPHLLLRYADTLRKTKHSVFKNALGSRSKRLLRKIIEGWSTKLLNYYATKYPNDLLQLVNLTHAKIPAGTFKFLKREPHESIPQDLAIILKTLEIADPKEFVTQAIFHDLPYELVRNKVPITTLATLPRADVRRLIEHNMPSTQLFLNIRSLQKFVDGSDLNYLISRKAPYVPLSYIQRALENVPMTALEVAYNEGATKIAKELITTLPSPSFLALIDASGSMSDNMKTVLSNYLIFRNYAKDTIFFSTHHYSDHHYSDLDVVHMKDMALDLTRLDQIRYIREYLNDHDMYGGTPMGEALTYAVSTARKQGLSVIVVFTDEQENGVTHSQEIATANPDLTFIIFNPSPYPAHSFNITNKNIFYVPCTTPESIIATLRLMQLLRSGMKMTSTEVTVPNPEPVEDEDDDDEGSDDD